MTLGWFCTRRSPHTADATSGGVCKRMKGRRIQVMLCLGLSLIMTATGLRVDRVWTRRGAMIAGGGLLTAPRAAPALFESPAQLAVISLAT